MAELGTHWEREGLGGGKVRLTQYLRPIAYNDAGILKRIVTDWVDSGITERPHIVSAAQLMCSVSDDGMRRLHPTREADRYLEVGAPYVKVAGVWTKVSFTNVIRTGNMLAWTRPEANLAIFHAGNYVKLALELKGGFVPQDNLIAFPVGLTGLTRSGASILADGVPVATIRAPDVYDAANPMVAHRPISYQFVTLNSQPYLLMTLPSLVGLTRPVVDPTLTLQPDATDGKDVSLYESSPTTLWGPDQAFFAWGNFPTALRANGLIFFSLSSIPAAAQIVSATLSLFHGAAKYPASKTYNIYSIAAANKDWTEAGACWDHLVGTTHWAGDVGTNGGTDAGCSVSGTDYESTSLGNWTYNVSDVNGTEYAITLLNSRIDDWFGSDDQNYGLIFRSADIIEDYFWPSECATAAYRPKLVVVYTSDTPVSMSLARKDILSDGGVAITSGQNILAKGQGISKIGRANAIGDGIFAQMLGLNQPVQASALDSAILARIQGLSGEGQAQGIGAFSLARSEGLDYTGEQALNLALTLTRIQGLSQGNVAAAIEGLVLAHTLGMNALGTAETAATLILALARALDHAGVTGNVISVDLTLAHGAGLIESASIGALAELTLARFLALTLAGQADADARTILGRAQTIVVLPSGQTLAVSMTLARQSDFGMDATLGKEASLTLSIGLDLTTTAQSDTKGALLLAWQGGIEAIAAAISTAGLTLNQIQAISLTATSISVIITMPTNTYVVPGEDRTFTVPKTSRIYSVPGEDRTFTVPKSG